MRVEQLGDGTPDLAVVAGIHGDEPCGVRAVERLLDDDPDVERPVTLVIANEKAIERDVRYVDEDLNRAFPGDPEAETHEGRLAHRLAAEVGDCLVLALHSTQSHADPFAVVDGVGELERRICPALSIAGMVDTESFVNGRLFAAAETVEVECGLQGSDRAAENAYTLTREFLTATGALPGAVMTRDLPVFQLTRQIPKEHAERYEVFVENFAEVAAGETFAAADGVELAADDAFYPVLMSPYGYESAFGYAAEKLGQLSD